MHGRVDGDLGELLLGSELDWSVTVAFDRRRLLKGGISMAAVREKEEEGKPRDPDPSSPSLVGRRRREEGSPSPLPLV
ncbi:hypothetical protein BHE74_00049658, partial [Ensete ventricosum]